MKIIVDQLPTNCLGLLERYGEKFLGDYTIEQLASTKSAINRAMMSPDTAVMILSQQTVDNGLVTLDLSEYDNVYIYDEYNGLVDFLTEQFGEDLSTSDNIMPSENIMANMSSVVDDIDFGTDDNLSLSSNFSTSDVSTGLSDTERKEYEDKISELKTELAQVSKLNSSLQEQIEGNSYTPEDMRVLGDTIKELKSTLQNKDEEIAKLRTHSPGSNALEEELDRVKKRLKDTQVELSNLRIEKNTLGTNYESAQQTIRDLNSKIADNTDKDDDIRILKKRVEELESTVELKTTALEASEREKDEAQNKLSLANEDLQRKQQKYNDLRNKADGIEARNQALESQITDVNKEKSDLNSKYIKLQAEKDELSSNLEHEKVTSEEKIRDLEGKVQNLETEVTDITNSKVTEIDKLQSEFNSDIEGKNNKITDLENQITSLKTELNENKTGKETEVSKLRAEMNSNMELKDSLIADLEAKVSNLQTDLDSSKEAKEKELSKLKTELTESIESKDNIINTKNQTIESLRNENSKLKNDMADLKSNDKSSELLEQIADLESELARAKDTNNENTDLENQINALTEAVNQKKSEIITLNTKLKEVKDNDKTSVLTAEVKRLKTELANAKTQAVNSQELVETRRKVANLELELSNANEELKEYNHGIFGKMSALKDMRSEFKLTIPMNNMIQNPCYCIASGSSESVLHTYKNIARACSLNTDRRYLIVDLASDSNIDAIFGIQNIVKPINWLGGKGTIVEAVSNSAINNVKVITTVSSVVNEIAYLSLNWGRIFNDFAAIGNNVIIILVVGSITNTVSKILFNTFSQYMRSYIVLKSSPVSFRTLLFELAVVSNLSNFVELDFIDFSSKTSACVPYNKLVEGYNTRVIHDSEVLDLK